MSQAKDGDYPLMQQATYVGGAVLLVIAFLFYNRTLKPMIALVAAVVVAGGTYYMRKTNKEIAELANS